MNDLMRLFWLLLLLISYTSSGQTVVKQKVDSLQEVLVFADREDRPEVYFELFKQFRMVNSEKALKYALNSYNAALANGDSLWIVKSTRAVGWVYQNQDLLEEAIDYYTSALGIAQRNDYKEEVKFLFNSLGITNVQKNDYDQALRYHLKSLKIRESESDTKGMAVSYNNIGIVYKRLRNYDKALKYYKKSLYLNHQIGRREALNRNYLNVGLIYIELDNYDSALFFFNKGLEFCGDDCDDQTLMWSNTGIGQALFFDGRHDSAEPKFQRSNVLAIKNQSDNYQTINYTFLAEIKLEQREFEKAIRYLDQARAIADSLSYKEYLMTDYELYAKIYSQLGDFEKAYDYHVRYRTIYDSVYTEDLMKNIANIQLDYQEEQNREVLKARDITIRATRRLNYVLIGASAIFIAFLSILYRNYREKQRTNRKLEEANTIIEKQKRRLEDTNAVLEDRVKERTKELQESYKALQQSNQDLDTFIYRTSHDIRGPLATLLGLSEVALFDVEDERSLDYFRKLNQTANNLNEILSRLLDINQVKSTSNFGQEIDFSRIIEDILDKKSQLDFFEEVDFSVQMTKNLVYRSDPYLIHTILDHLIDNAYKFHNSSDRVDSFVKVEIGILEEGLDLKVLDNGIGISEEDTVRIFEIFSKASNRPDTAGLGLYLVKLAVERLEGNVHVETTSEGYTEFKVRLPLW